jgi:hypothetical protein
MWQFCTCNGAHNPSADSCLMNELLQWESATCSIDFEATEERGG